MTAITMGISVLVCVRKLPVLQCDCGLLVPGAFLTSMAAK